MDEQQNNCLFCNVFEPMATTTADLLAMFRTDCAKAD